MLRIPENIYNDIIAYAKEGLPLEVCGILGGVDCSITVNYQMTNTDAMNDHFTMDPREQIDVMKDLRRKGLEMTACYHSHPTGPDHPSAEDVRLSYYPDVFSVIISMAEPGNPVVKSYAIKDGQVEQVPLDIVSAG
jgi:proteasome lid subunit RPN8/RPN11